MSLKIAVDAAGGDHYPHHPVQGAIAAVTERDDLHIVLVGPESMVKGALLEAGYTGDRISVVDAPEIISMEDSVQAIKAKPNSSIVIGLGMHAQKHVDAFVSAGHTGVLLAASAVILGRLPGVLRPTISSVYPTTKGFRIMVDVGANLEVKPEMLYQFALMGEVYAKSEMGIEFPRIGLLNVGEEEEKGTETLRKAHELLKSHPRFVGNMEGRDILSGQADVFVCDGLVGNLILKFGESIPEAIQHLVGVAIAKQGLTPEQVKPVMGVLKQAFAPFDYQAVGGVPFLGVNGVSFVGHGGSTSLAIKNMIFKAASMVKHQVNEKIVAAVS